MEFYKEMDGALRMNSLPKVRELGKNIAGQYLAVEKSDQAGAKEVKASYLVALQGTIAAAQLLRAEADEKEENRSRQNRWMGLE